MKTWIVLALVALTPALARAEIQDGAIDWQRRVIRTKGAAAPNPNAPNVAAARIGAERAAKADALRNILETLKGVQVSGGKTAGDLMTDPGTASKVQGTVKGFKVVDTRYFSDGGVEVDVEMPLDGLVDALVPGRGTRKAEDAGSGPSGLVIDARALALAPAIAPRVFDEDGNELYGPASVEAGRTPGGLAAYVKDLDGARKDARVGEKPLVVKALALGKGSSSDVVLSRDDAKRAREARVSEGNVVFVVQ
jgi:hypothetical protein